MPQDLIKTPVKAVISHEGSKLVNIQDADGNVVIYLLDWKEADRLVNTLNVLSGKLSGDPNGTATKEERELWRQTSITWSNRLEKEVRALLSCFEKDDNSKWGIGWQVPVYELAEGKTDNERDKCLHVLEVILSIGDGGKDNCAEVKRKLSCL